MISAAAAAARDIPPPAARRRLPASCRNGCLGQRCSGSIRINRAMGRRTQRKQGQHQQRPIANHSRRGIVVQLRRRIMATNKSNSPKKNWNTLIRKPVMRIARFLLSGISAPVGPLCQQSHKGRYVNLWIKAANRRVSSKRSWLRRDVEPRCLNAG
jgi:hypothetical protein